MHDLTSVLGVIFAVRLPLSIPIVLISLNYRNRRRLMVLHHVERMAAIERGMEIPPLPLELIDGKSKKRRSSLLPGLVWFFSGLAMVAGSMASGDDLPIVLGLVP